MKFQTIATILTVATISTVSATTATAAIKINGGSTSSILNSTQQFTIPSCNRAGGECPDGGFKCGHPDGTKDCDCPTMFRQWTKQKDSIALLTVDGTLTIGGTKTNTAGNYEPDPNGNPKSDGTGTR